MIDEQTDEFIKAYRESMDKQKDLAMQNLETQRRNDFANIMSRANQAGMMYSNFPQRSKLQYDTQTYLPGRAKIQSTYQTGLQKLRENVIDTSNQLKSINEAIAELNNDANEPIEPETPTYSSDLGDYYSAAKGFQFVDENNNPIRANTWATKTGQNVWDVVKGMASAGDVNATRALAGYSNANKQLTDEEVAAFGALGISTAGYGRRP